MKKRLKVVLQVFLVLLFASAGVAALSACSTSEFTITFITNGGSSVESIKATKGNTVDLRKHIPKLENYAFDGWYLDKEFNYNSDMSLWNVIKNSNLYAKWSPMFSILDDVATLDKGHIYGYETFEIPETHEGYPVKTINIFAFLGSSIKQVKIPASVEIIGSYAFQNSKLTEIFIPETVKTIYHEAFAGCIDLTSVTFSADCNFDELSFALFKGSRITELRVPSSKSYSATFSDCLKLRKVIIPVGIDFENIRSVFERSDFIEEVVCESVFVDYEIQFSHTKYYKALKESAGVGLFYDDNNVAVKFFGAILQTIKVREGTTAIAPGCFNGFSNLEEVVLPSTVTSIGKNAFSKGLTTINLPSGLKYVGDNALPTSVVGITELPSALEFAGRQTFQNQQITALPATLKVVNAAAFLGCE